MIAIDNQENRYQWTAAAGYDGIETTSRRRPPRAIVQSEDNVAKKADRKKLVSTARDVRRNFSVARWAINKHLDFVVNHTFRATTPDPEWNRTLEAFFKFASHRQRYDSRGKHPRRRFMRLLEASRVVDGDVFGLKLRGGRTQAIEGDRILNPSGKDREPDSKWTHGILKDRWGGASRYAIHRREKTRLIFEREISARKVIPFGYFDRFDQDRGISPITSAIKEFRDVYDGIDYALAREKVNQLFTFLITRDSQESFWESDPDGTGENVNTDKEPYEVDFGSGPNVLDLDPGDDAKYLNSQGTSDQSQNFWDTVIAIALKSIDIPFSFFKENFTNFFGSRAALMIYLKACKWKREDVQDYEDEWLRWRLREGELNGEILIPSGFDVENVSGAWRFTPDGVPWWNPLQEVQANILAVDNYQRSRGEIREEQFGDDWFEMMDRRRQEDLYLLENDYPTTVPKTPIFDLGNSNNDS